MLLLQSDYAPDLILVVVSMRLDLLSSLRWNRNWINRQMSQVQMFVKEPTDSSTKVSLGRWHHGLFCSKNVSVQILLIEQLFVFQRKFFDKLLQIGLVPISCGCRFSHV